MYIFHLMKFRDKCRCRRDDVICRVASLFAAFTITFKNQKIRDALYRASPAPPVIREELSSPRSALRYRCRCPGDVGGSDSPVPAAAAAPRCPPRPPGGAGEQPTGAAAGAERGRAAARRGETPPREDALPFALLHRGQKNRAFASRPPPPVCLEDALALFFLIYTQHVGCGEAGERPALTHRPCWRGYIKLLISLPDGKSLINRSQAH